MQLLPVPDNDDIDGFIALIKKLYGKDIPRQEAADILGRLMRFYYLTRLKPWLTQSTPENPKKVKSARFNP